jgi:hypothetical protein
MEERLALQEAASLLSDFFEKGDLKQLAWDAGILMDCPLLVLDDTFHILAYYKTDGFADPLFDKAVQLGQITYEAGAIISKSPLLSAGKPDYINLEDSTHRRRFAPLISAGVRHGYLICVDVDDHLQTVSEDVFRTVETVLAKQLLMEAGQQERPFETSEEILMHLLDGGFSSVAYFRLQTAETYLADFHPEAFALIDLAAYHTLYIGKSTLKDELTYRFYASHPFLYKGDVLLFLHKGYNIADFDALADEFHLKVAVSDPIGDLFDLPALYRPVREALDLMTETSFHSGSVFHVAQLKPLLLLSSLQTRSDLVSERIRFLSVCDREKGSQYCETLYYYLSSGRSLKETCAALFTHRNTILYRIHKMQDEYGVLLDAPSAHLELLLGVSLALFRTKGADFFLTRK